MSERFLRPEMEVLGEETLVPAQNRVKPAPNRFTHRVVEDTPFYYDTEEAGGEPNGYFKAGTDVVLVVEGTEGRCRVVDGQGIYTEVRASSLVERPAD